MATFVKHRNLDGSISWEAKVRRTGHQNQSRSFRTKLEARLWARQTEDQLAGRTSVLAKRLTVAQMIDAVLPSMKPQSDAAIAYWKQSIGHLRLRKVTHHTVAEHCDLLLGAPCRGHGHKTSKPRAPQTVKNYLLCLSGCYEHAIRQDFTDSNPVAKVDRPTIPKGRVRYLSADEQVKLLAECKRSESKDLYLFTLFCLTTGCRRGEAAALLWANVNLDRRRATFVETKNGDTRSVWLTEAVADLLRSRRRDGKRVFGSDVGKAWDNAIKRAQIGDFHFHDLRHSAASKLAESGASLIEIGKILGHKTAQTTLRYSHISDDHSARLVDRVMSDIS